MGFVFLACARVGLRACVWFLGVVRVPRVWCAGCRKSGEGTCRLVPFPAFSSFCVEQTTGLEPAASTLVGWRSGLVSYVRKCVFPGCPLRFCLFARGSRWGLERMTGVEPATFTLAR